MKPLAALLGQVDATDPDELFDAYQQWAQQCGKPLYPHQAEALLGVVTGEHVIATTPTGSGKTLMATAAIFAALAAGRRAFYTAPIKALVSERFFELTELLGTDSVGMITGDSAVNPEAPVICCTAEILALQALRYGDGVDIGAAVMDEFHYYADAQRGWAWQVPLLELAKTQFMLLSATLGDPTFFAEDLKKRTGRDVTVVDQVTRPVPLFYHYETTPLPELLPELVHTKRAPVYMVNFSQADAAQRAQALTSLKLATREQRDEIADQIAGFPFAAGFGKTLSRIVRHGIGIHHAGMLPKYRRLVERLAQAGLLTVICGTDTLGVGINVPIRTVLLTGLAKYDGQRMRLLSTREFHQITGRAGRAGFDVAGDVIVAAPEHEIVNAKALAKAGDDPAKLRKVVRRKPLEGSINWTASTAQRLEKACPEPLTSHFQLTHTMLLGALARPGDPVQTLRNLIEGSHESRPQQRRHLLRAIAIGRSLLASGVVERLDVPEPDGRRYRLTVELPADFAMNQPLAPFLLAAIDLLDSGSEDYCLDVISLVEATLDSPGVILAAQRKHARGEAVAAMKADGIEYEQRMALLEEITHPRPLAPLIEAAFESYQRGHPWAADYPPEPKSIVRDMFSRAMSFVEYINFYSLARAEGVVLRYLADAYRTLDRTLPESARSSELDDLIAWLGELVRGVDSSLLTEWSELVSGTADDQVASVRPAVRQDDRGFVIAIRNAMFRRVELAARGAWAELGELDPSWPAHRWQQAMADYFDEYPSLSIDADARSATYFQLVKGPEVWRARQIFADPDDDLDWGITAEIDLAASETEGQVVLRVIAVEPLDTAGILGHTS